jgi:uncharacterized protein (DUF1684 family)
MPSTATDAALQDALDLLDWKRHMFELYAAVRRAPSPPSAWHLWRRGRDELFRHHPQSPLMPEQRRTFAGIEYFDYDPELRFRVEVETCEAVSLEIEGSAASRTRFRRIGVARSVAGALELYWLEGYGGGIFLPFGDTTNGSESYTGGRYLLDTVKGADLGSENGHLILDFNFAYNPSCSYDVRWACPLPPSANRLTSAIRAGERYPAGSGSSSGASISTAAAC